MTTGSDEVRPEQPRDDDAYALDPRTVAAILYAVEVDDRDKLIELMEPLHAADIADLLEQIDP
ncbi:MAG: magnesium transporter, partial [Ruegeria sp.]|nr:magnesium transporter [Ruegeria sp.]